jgi:hypothetical protein
MEGQKTILDKSVAAAEDNASAAKSGAEAANKNVEMFVSKERARVRVELSPFSVDDKVTTTRLVKFVITMHGTTSAFITNSGATAYYLPEEAIHEPDVGSAVMFPIYHLPKTISPGTPPIESYAFVFIGDETLVIPELESERLIIGIRGFIEYNDVFDKSRETRFRYAWSLSEGAVAGLGLIKKLSEGEWIKSGPPGDNKET